MIAFVSFSELKDAGLDPITALLILAVIALGGWIKWFITSQNALRESWHSDTRGQVTAVTSKFTALEKKHEETLSNLTTCEIVRQGLEWRVKGLEDENEEYRKCYAKSCPFKKFTT